MQLTSASNRVCCLSGRTVFLLLALGMPLATPSVAESVSALAGEMETCGGEDSKECQAVSEFGRITRRHEPAPGHPSESCPVSSTHAGYQHGDLLVVVGHRLHNGLCAPLRC